MKQIRWQSFSKGMGCAMIPLDQTTSKGLKVLIVYEEDLYSATNKKCLSTYKILESTSPSALHILESSYKRQVQVIINKVLQLH